MCHMRRLKYCQAQLTSSYAPLQGVASSGEFNSLFPELLSIYSDSSQTI